MTNSRNYNALRSDPHEKSYIRRGDTRLGLKEWLRL